MTDREKRLKRLKIRCWRRGTKEMDLLLGGFADGGAADLDDAGLAALEALLDENDNDLYAWVSGALDVPDRHAPTIARLRGYHGLGS